jgi:hypothetical protein
MRWLIFLSVFPLFALMIGCESSSTTPPTTQQAAYHPADGRNLSPELQKDFGADPNWPNDINRGGGGGRQ